MNKLLFSGRQKVWYTTPQWFLRKTTLDFPYTGMKNDRLSCIEKKDNDLSHCLKAIILKNNINSAASLINITKFILIQFAPIRNDRLFINWPKPWFDLLASKSWRLFGLNQDGFLQKAQSYCFLSSQKSGITFSTSIRSLNVKLFTISMPCVSRG